MKLGTIEGLNKFIERTWYGTPAAFAKDKTVQERMAVAGVVPPEGHVGG